MTSEAFSVHINLHTNNLRKFKCHSGQTLNGYEEMQGYQADIAADWWGKLYEEHGRELLWNEPGDKFVLPGEWNKYEIRAAGAHIQTWINGNLCVDLEDPDGKRRGVFGLQVHSGGPTEVRFRNLNLKILPSIAPAAE